MSVSPAGTWMLPITEYVVSLDQYPFTGPEIVLTGCDESVTGSNCIVPEINISGE
ncbi:MAG: hypothetical protein V3W14_01360 [Candidatus Neomarinimicrobiota bacterium]